MNDGYENAAWAGGHHAWSNWARDAVAATRAVFERLVAQHYDAPWRRLDEAERAASSRGEARRA